MWTAFTRKLCTACWWTLDEWDLCMYSRSWEL